MDFVVVDIVMMRRLAVRQAVLEALKLSVRVQTVWKDVRNQLLAPKLYTLRSEGIV